MTSDLFGESLISSRRGLRDNGIYMVDTRGGGGAHDMPKAEYYWPQHRDVVGTERLCRPRLLYLKGRGSGACWQFAVPRTVAESFLERARLRVQAAKRDPVLPFTMLGIATTTVVRRCNEIVCIVKVPWRSD